MDFKSIAQKLNDITVNAMNSGKNALLQSTEFTYGSLRKTTAVLKNGADFETVRMEKKLVIFTLGKTDDVSKNIFVQLPLVYSKAWIESATLRFIFSEESPDLVQLLGLETPSVVYYQQGEQKFLLTSKEDIEEFVKTFHIRRPEATENSESIVDQVSAEEKTPSIPNA